MNEIPSFIEGMPKAELHVHIEGTLEPELKFELAVRNGLSLPYSSAEDMRAAYSFHDLSSFLAVYYEGMSVLLNEESGWTQTREATRRSSSATYSTGHEARVTT